MTYFMRSFAGKTEEAECTIAVGSHLSVYALELHVNCKCMGSTIHVTIFLEVFLKEHKQEF